MYYPMPTKKSHLHNEQIQLMSGGAQAVKDSSMTLVGLREASLHAQRTLLAVSACVQLI